MDDNRSERLRIPIRYCEATAGYRQECFTRISDGLDQTVRNTNEKSSLCALLSEEFQKCVYKR